MAKIPQSNYTQIPNVFFDEILEGLNLAETKVLLAIMRKTFGWQKKIVYVEADSSTYALIKFLCENQGASDYKAVEEVAE